ncbi:MAG: hcpD 1 [Burkholderiaceae bacterium]|nr:hcpD 1 [Burkholderiaceae bacterium]
MDMFNEAVWPDFFDDREIDDIVWDAIKDSPSRADFVCYLIHRPQKAQYRDQVQQRLQTMENSGQAPTGYTQAAERIRALAETGHPTAIFHMGKMHVLGLGMKQDMQEAESWYRRGIAAGELRSHCNLGWIYLYGFGNIPEDKDEAFRLLSIGAEGGVHVAKASVGLMLLAGEGCEADPARGLALLEESYNEGYNNAGNQIADAYFLGKHVPQDLELAHEWLTKVADRGDERSMAILGHYLVSGSHGKTDVARGLQLLHNAMASGFLPAYQWIGNLYRDGQGVDRNLQTALIWYEKGAAAGNTSCDTAITTLKLMMSPPVAGPDTMQ